MRMYTEQGSVVIPGVYAVDTSDRTGSKDLLALCCVSLTPLKFSCRLSGDTGGKVRIHKYKQFLHMQAAGDFTHVRTLMIMESSKD